MPDAKVIIEGRLATNPCYGEHNGRPVVNLRVLAGRSRRRDDNSWETLSTTAYECAFWGPYHDLVVNLGAATGDSVIITGTIGSITSYQGKNGESLSAKVNATGLQVFPKQQGGYQPQAQQGQQPSQGYGQPQRQASNPDPWNGGGNEERPPF